MAEIKKISNSEVEIVDVQDKWHSPYLLAASFQSLVEFRGSYSENHVLHWKFSPKDKVLELIRQLRQKTEPRIPVIDFIMAVDTFWKEVSESKNFYKPSSG